MCCLVSVAVLGPVCVCSVPRVCAVWWVLLC